MIDVINISKKVLSRLSEMGYEKDGGSSSEQLIFPNKVQVKGNVKRISEQELRFLFIEEFKIDNKDLCYSIETPTEEKYKFGKDFDEIKVNIDGQSALLDMCVFKNKTNKYKRILNIEFKHKNASIEKIGKDILKLMHEKQKGVFIHLLNNTRRDTLCNKMETGVLDKYLKSFNDFNGNWEGDKNKYIQLIIISLDQKTLIHRKINKEDLKKTKAIFSFKPNNFNIKDIIGNGWETETIE